MRGLLLRAEVLGMHVQDTSYQSISEAAAALMEDEGPSAVTDSALSGLRWVKASAELPGAPRQTAPLGAPAAQARLFELWLDEALREKKF